MKLLLHYAKLILSFSLIIVFAGCDDDDAELPQVEAGFTFTFNENTGTVSFLNTSSRSTTYLWAFGDGQTSTEINPIKTYPTGTFIVSLTASNEAGASDVFVDTLNISVKAAVSLPITFDAANVNYAVTTFNGTAFTIVDNPDLSGTNDEQTKVGRIVNSGVAFEGIFFDLGTPVNLTTDKRINMNFWSEAAIPVLLKLEEGTAADVEVTANHGGTGWETISFNFTSSASYSRFTLFVDGPGTTAGTFYFDDVVQTAGSQAMPPMEAAPAPTQAAANVISIYSNTYTNVAREGLNLYGAAAFEEVAIAGNNVLKYTFASGDGGNFQVIELGGANQIDAAANGMTNFRFDLWFPNPVNANSAFLLKLVNIGATTSEASINITPASTPAMAQGAWLQFDIPFTVLETNGLAGRSDIQQVVVDLVNAGQVYIDNIYFYKSATAPVLPTSPAPTPTQAAANVISIYSNAYTNVGNQGYNLYGAAAFEEVTLMGNNALKYTFVSGDGGNFQVIELGAANQINAAAAGMTNFRFDLWFPNAVSANSEFLLKLVNIAGSNPEAQINISPTSTPAMAQGSWLQFDIPFSVLETNGLTARENLQQVVIDLKNSGQVYVDNIYFYKTVSGPVAPTSPAPTPTQAAANVISIYSDAYTDVTNEGFNLYGAAAFEEADINGNKALKYTAADGNSGKFQVIELGAANQINAAANGMTNFRFDLWFPNAVDASSAFLMRVVNIMGTTSEANINITPSSNPAMAQGAWLQYDIPLATLQSNGLAGISNIQQVVVDLVNSGQVYIDNIYFYKPAGSSGPVAPTNPAPTPSQAAADVISIYSNAYTNVANQGFNQYGAAAFEEVSISGNGALKYTAADGGGGKFQVIELGAANQIDAAAAGMTNFRFDLWFPNAVNTSSAFLMKVVNILGSTTEANINITPSSNPAMAQGTWLQYDIPLATLQANGLAGISNIQQVVVDLMNSGQVYIDNIYFYKPAGSSGPVAPTNPAPTPTQAAADVVSIYSDAYTNVANQGFNQYGAAAFEEVSIMGNTALKYTFVDGSNGNFQVLELGGPNQINAAAAGMTNFRFDLWFPNAVNSGSTFLMKVVNIMGSATEANITITPSSNPAMAQGTWLQYDVPLATLQANGLAGISNIQQVVVDLMNAGQVYIDNIYFYKTPAPPATSIINLTFSNAASIDNWMRLADANSAEGSITWNATGGVEGGAMQVAGTNPSTTAGKAYIFQLDATGLNYDGASSVRLTFDLKLGAPLVAAAVHLQTNIPGVGVTNNFDLQGQGLNESTYTSYSFDFSGVAAAASTISIHFNIASGAVNNAGGVLLVDNVKLVKN